MAPPKMVMKAIGGKLVFVPASEPDVSPAAAPPEPEPLPANGPEIDEEKSSVSPALSDAGEEADETIPDLSQHLLGSVQDVVRDMGLETQCTNYREFALSKIRDGKYREKLTSFLDTPRAQPAQSLVPVEAFISNTERSDWDTHCPEIDEHWDRYTQAVKPLLGDDYPFSWLCKPSGPMRARLLVLWHYPTTNTPNNDYSHSMDPGNPCLRSQKSKISLPSDIRTQDINPIRMSYSHDNKPNWNESFPRWDDIRRLNHQFAVATCLDVPFVLVLGKTPFEDLQLAAMRRGWRIRPLDINLQTQHLMFQSPLRLYLAVDADDQVRQVILRCFHSEYAFKTARTLHGSMMDFMWNLACEFAGVTVKNPRYFLFRVSVNNGKVFDPSRPEVKADSGFRLRELWKREQASDRAITMEEVEIYFQSKLDAVPELRKRIEECAQRGESRLTPIEQIRREKGAATLRERNRKRKELLPEPTPGPKRLKNTNNDGGQATKATDKWQASAKGQAALDGQKKGQKTCADRLDAKYHAFMNIYQVRQLEIARATNTLTGEQRQALTRVNTVKKLWDEQNRKELTNVLTRHVVFYDPVKYPRGVRYDGDKGPAQVGADPYADEDHPACVILKGSRLLRTADQKRDLAGPLQT